MHVNGEQLNHNDCGLSLVSFFFCSVLIFLDCMSQHIEESPCAWGKKQKPQHCALSNPWKFSWSPSCPSGSASSPLLCVSEANHQPRLGVTLNVPPAAAQHPLLQSLESLLVRAWGFTYMGCTRVFATFGTQIHTPMYREGEHLDAHVRVIAHAGGESQ